MKKIIYILLAIIVCVVAVIGIKNLIHKELLDSDDIETAITVDPASGKYISADAYTDLLQIYTDNGGSEEDFDQYLEGRLADIYQEESIKINRPVKEVEKPLREVIYLDNTASMRGFIQPKGQKADISKFVSIFNSLRKNYDGSTTAYYVDNGNLIATTLDAMTTSLNDKKLPMGDAYSMSQFFKTVVDSTIADTTYNVVSFFVTDAIMSGTNDDITRNPKYNIDHAETLSTDIAAAVRPLKDKGYGTAVLRFEAPFDGNYITYANGSVALDNRMRPFFMIVVAPNSQIIKLGKEISDNHRYSPTDMMIIATRPDRPTVNVVGIGDADVNYDNDKYEATSDSDTPGVTLNISLANMPEYLRDKETALKALEIKCDNPAFTPKPTYSESDNIISFNYTFTPDRTSERFHVKIRDVMPQWVESYNSADDAAITYQLDKTFNLKWFVKGLADGLYGRDSGEYIGQPVTVEIDKK